VVLLRDRGPDLPGRLAGSRMGLMSEMGYGLKGSG
jgi:hypothetical protein